MANNVTYDVEKILDRKYEGGITYYLLKWKSYDHSENTWEPESNLSCTELLQKFEALRPAQLEAYKKKHAAEIGFGRGLEPDMVVGVTIVRDKILYGVKWVDNREADIIESVEVAEKCPHLIVEFFLESIGYRPGEPQASSSDADKGVRLNGGSHGVEASLESRCTSPHVLQHRLDAGGLIDKIKGIIQDPISKDLIYSVQWHDIAEDEYVPADFVHLYFQIELIKYFEENFYYKEVPKSKMVSDIRPALESLAILD